MSKKERNKKVRHLLKSVNAEYTILDRNDDEWRHVRVNGFGDIWPNTGTYRQGSAWHKRNYTKMITALEIHFNITPSEEVDVIDNLSMDSVIINELLKRVEDLEMKVYQLEQGK